MFIQARHGKRNPFFPKLLLESTDQRCEVWMPDRSVHCRGDVYTLSAIGAQIVRAGQTGLSPRD